MRKEIIIIGAGMSGIMAANTLKEAGISVTVLEARDRIGGRTHTDHALGTSIDLGAAWIHGPVGNPLTPLKDEFGVKGNSTEIGAREDESYQAFREDGRPLDMIAFKRALTQIEGYVEHHTSSILSPPLTDEIRSVDAVVTHVVSQVAPLTGIEQMAYHYGQQISTALWEAADAAEVDWYMRDNYVELPGGDILLSGGGYSKIITGLAQDLDVRLGAVVSAVDYSSERVAIQTNQGPFEADGVICTAPLGVLKSNQIQFTPPLPQEKRDAIGRIGFGVAEKLILRFDQFYWPKEKEYFAYIPDDGSQYFSSWINYGFDCDLPIIGVYITGSHAKAANQWSDGMLIEKGLEVLSRMFGELPPPVSYRRTGWQHDPYSMGSYSFDRVNQQGNDRHLLAQPVDNRLFFAGEATHPTYLGTVHGAYETGIRAAREVLKHN